MTSEVSARPGERVDPNAPIPFHHDPSNPLLTDLACRRLGGSVVAANDDTFADRAHLIAPGDAAWDPKAYGPYGKTYDGWETRRRREAGHDHAVIRLGAAGIVRSVVIDTAWFKGNFPPFASVEGLAVDGYPSQQELEDADWKTVLPRSPLLGDHRNVFVVQDQRRWTHLRLSIYPDGGVARFRALGDVVPDPRMLTGTVDLVSLEHGGRVLDSSDSFYSPASNLINPGVAATIAEGWETKRRRDDGNDWVLFELAGAGELRMAEIDTSLFVGNAPGAARLMGLDARKHALADEDAWLELMPRTPLRPDTRHRFRLRDLPPVTHARLDVNPDGGMARVRLYGELGTVAAQEVALRWLNALPLGHLRDVLTEVGKLTDDEAAGVLDICRGSELTEADLPANLRVHLLE